MKTFFAFVVAVAAGQAMAMSIQDGNDVCADCIAFITDRQEMDLESIDDKEAKMNIICSTMEPSKVEECKTKVQKICQKKKDKVNSQTPEAICKATKFCPSLDTVNMNTPTNEVQGKGRCKDCKNFLKDVKEKEMDNVISVNKLIETMFCEKLSEDRHEQCADFLDAATGLEIELLDLVDVKKSCNRLGMCGAN
ncbi:prosaposin-like [Haliotis rufescens]|uniref:prosaposin-like n=1 Tax=Haliotis rufescens TaxID=6454 RepID=UPI00201F492D|nr:prosaposin-like [Haliotis rufescens]